jgi:hypothetical protein
MLRLDAAVVGEVERATLYVEATDNKASACLLTIFAVGKYAPGFLCVHFFPFVVLSLTFRSASKHIRWTDANCRATRKTEIARKT